MKHYGGFRHRSDEKTWLTRIAINCCKNMMRKKWYRNEREELDGAVSSDTEDELDGLIEKSCVSQGIMQLDPDDRLDGLIEKSCVSQGIMQLDPDDREILILFYYQELTLREIASVIRRSENAPMQRLSRAKKRLKKILEGLL